MDALSEVISYLKPKATMTGVTEAYAPWGIQFTGYDYVTFGFISEGTCFLSFKGNKKSFVLEEGDAWILINPLEFRVGSALNGPTLRSVDIYRICRQVLHPYSNCTTF